MEYLIIPLILLASAIILEWKYKIRLYSSLKERLLTTLIFFIIGVLWDHFAIYRGHWSFGTGLIGFKIGLMPIEEYLFILIIPFWVLTIYKVIDKKLNKNWFKKLFRK